MLRIVFLTRHYFMKCEKYKLSSHAFICASGDYYVILDAKQDRYLCLRKHDFHQLEPWMQIDWETSDSVAGVCDEPTAVARLLAARLLSLGILNEGTGRGNRARIRTPDVPAESLLTAIQSPSLLSSLPHFPAFVAACWRAAYQLRNRSLYRIIEIHRLRTRRRQRSSELTEALARKLVAFFNKLRPLYPRKPVCLFDSLALLEFFYQFGFTPMLVFGVQAEPFEAHCWIQHGRTVINDTVVRAQAFTPIMAVY
jgi:hypothetical protein